jgi:NAD(P)H dehydrogenase (quinone)
MSQMTVSQMSLLEQTGSRQQTLHWLSEQALNWSGLPVAHVRSTVFQQHPFFSAWAAESIADNGTLKLPFGAGKTSPVDSADVAEVVAAMLSASSADEYAGKVVELTGPQSQDMRALAAEYAAALRTPVTFVDVPYEQWRRELEQRGLPAHVAGHLDTMAQLHRAGRYDRLTRDVERITGHPATSLREYVARHGELFKAAGKATSVATTTMAPAVATTTCVPAM